MIKLLLSIFLILGLSLPTFADLAIVVHPENPNTLDVLQVKKIFLGKTRMYPDGSEASPFQQVKESVIRKEFNKRVLKKKEWHLNAYWARMLFSSKGKPPRTMDSTQAMKNMIAKNRNAIGYFDSADVDGTLKVLFTIE